MVWLIGRYLHAESCIKYAAAAADGFSNRHCKRSEAPPAGGLMSVFTAKHGGEIQPESRNLSPASERRSLFSCSPDCGGKARSPRRRGSDKTPCLWSEPPLPVFSAVSHAGFGPES